MNNQITVYEIVEERTDYSTVTKCFSDKNEADKALIDAVEHILDEMEVPHTRVRLVPYSHYHPYPICPLWEDEGVNVNKELSSIDILDEELESDLEKWESGFDEDDKEYISWDLGGRCLSITNIKETMEVHIEEYSLPIPIENDSEEK